MGNRMFSPHLRRLQERHELSDRPAKLGVRRGEPVQVHLGPLLQVMAEDGFDSNLQRKRQENEGVFRFSLYVGGGCYGREDMTSFEDKEKKRKNKNNMLEDTLIALYFP